MTRPSLAPLALAALAACGGTKKSAPPPPDPKAYFNLKLDACVEYSTTSAAQTPPALGVSPEDADLDAYPKPNFRLWFRKSSTWVRKWVVTVSGQDVLLDYVERNEGGSDSIWTFSPPVKLGAAPLPSGGRFETSTTAVNVVNGGAGQTSSGFTVRVDVGAAETVQTALGAKQAFPLFVQGIDAAGATQTVDHLWVAPGEGVVQAQLDGDPNTFLAQGERTATTARPCGMGP